MCSRHSGPCTLLMRGAEAGHELGAEQVAFRMANDRALARCLKLDHASTQLSCRGVCTTAPWLRA
jgi:hypothetical protein